MKFGASSAAWLVSCSSVVDASNLLAARGGRRASEGLSLVTPPSLPDNVLHFGDTACPCIGFDNVQGDTTVEFEGGQQVAFPADLGARCEKWDENTAPECTGKDKPRWCTQPWCFVDSCNCHIPGLPTMSVYAADARYRGKPVFYSYATCGGEDTWTKVVPEVGTAGCRCIGFDNIPGTTDVKIDDKVVSYPAELGGTCSAWDKKKHPACQGENPEPWCTAKWCYVDPCSCKLDERPKVTMYLPKATFTGKSLYYSYETCGAKDTFTEKYNLHACVNQKDEKSCMAQVRGARKISKCAWTHGHCLGAELVHHPLCGDHVEAVKVDYLEALKGKTARAESSGLVTLFFAVVAVLAAKP